MRFSMNWPDIKHAKYRILKRPLILILFIINVVIITAMFIQNTFDRPHVDPVKWDLRWAIETCPTRSRSHHYALNSRITHIVLVMGKDDMAEYERLMKSWAVYPPTSPNIKVKNDFLVAGPLATNVAISILMVAPHEDPNELNTLRKELQDIYNELPIEVRNTFDSNLQMKFLNVSMKWKTETFGRTNLFNQLVEGYLSLRESQWVLYLPINAHIIRDGWLQRLDLVTRFPNPYAIVKSSIVRSNSKNSSGMDVNIPFLDEMGLYYLGDHTLKKIQLQIYEYFNGWGFTGQAGSFNENMSRYIHEDINKIDIDEESEIFNFHVNGRHFAHLLSPTYTMLTVENEEDWKNITQSDFIKHHPEIVLIRLKGGNI